MWFCRECKQAKRLCKHSLYIFKSHNFELEYKKDYLEARKAYNRRILIKKNQFTLNSKNKLANIKNSSEFWTTFEKFNTRKSFDNPIALNPWENLYDDTLPA